MNRSKKKAFRGAMELWPQTFGFARSLCRDRAEAEDLCQEAFLRLWAMDRPLDDSRPLRPLLFTVVKNLFRNRAARLRPEALDDLEGAADELVDPLGIDPGERAERREQSELIEAALERMNPIWRAALYLADGLGWSHAEIGEVLDRTEEVIKVTLHRARLRVRVMLKSRIAEGAE